jgi:hypothetical protein
MPVMYNEICPSIERDFLSSRADWRCISIGISFVLASSLWVMLCLTFFYLGHNVDYI